MSHPEVVESQYVVLRKLAEIGQPMNLLEIGFTATPFVIRNMAARGMVKVTVEITQRGAEAMERTKLRKLRKRVKGLQADRARQMLGVG